MSSGRNLQLHRFIVLLAYLTLCFDKRKIFSPVFLDHAQAVGQIAHDKCSPALLLGASVSRRFLYTVKNALSWQTQTTDNCMLVAPGLPDGPIHNFVSIHIMQSCGVDVLQNYAQSRYQKGFRQENCTYIWQP
jgi:hypothetical protein